VEEIVRQVVTYQNYAQVVSCSEPCDELAGSTKGEGFVNHMPDCLVLKDSAACN